MSTVPLVYAPFVVACRTELYVVGQTFTWKCPRRLIFCGASEIPPSERNLVGEMMVVPDCSLTRSASW